MLLTTDVLRVPLAIELDITIFHLAAVAYEEVFYRLMIIGAPLLAVADTLLYHVLAHLILEVLVRLVCECTHWGPWS